MPTSREPTLASLRRDRVLLWLWVPGGMGLILLAMQVWARVVGKLPPLAFAQTLSVLWIVTMFLLIWRNSSQRCPDCGHRYLRAFPWMSLKKVRCAACGYELK